MLNLIKKDIMLTIENLLINIVFLLLIWGPMSLLSIDKFTFIMIFTFANSLLAIMNFEIGNMLENRYQSNMLVISLPLRRNHVVISKYLVAYINQMLYCIMLYVYIQFLNTYSILGDFMTVKGVGLEVVFYALSVCLIYNSIGIPLYYKYRDNARVISFALEGLIIALPGYLVKNYIKPNSLIVLDSLGYSVIVFAISLIIYLFSMKISIKIYDNQEF